MDSKDSLLTTKQTAEILGLAPETLTTWRCRHRYDLPYYRIGRNIFYRPYDVEDFIKKGLCQHKATVEHDNGDMF